ncbi:chitobiase/beta-hexosaminidase C-terminal domain-containing protein [Microbacterium maritypicum]|uniref:chitobiase/beta-hexosaminidase C-terminal domain-containing protein n=1 Tax=Microbacterium maritypicum TaxID=33918 RepID=UPI002670F613|nr:chitobiase/beta-hexosaminidase C-terminal domain-containing protein [Microbacterium liquefaciens]WKT90709.1 chitobiase/beta-hexosaminidase C-terminal domain-containing protein [Microbacterium liquefaciens]
MKRQIAGVCTLAAVAAVVAFPLAANAADGLAAPTFSQEGGRFTESATVALTAPQGAEIRYTLDGSTPTAKSPIYKKPLVIEETTNLAAVSIKGGVTSPAEIEGYIIKTEEEPQLSFFVMSDVHTSSLDDKNRGIWSSHFDTLASINPDPDLIISNGDQINDNNNNTAPDHQVVKTIFDENIDRLGLDDTPILMSHGNHDVGNADMAKYYGDWFPNASGGYYEKTIDGQTFLVIDTERYSGAQRTWLQGRLAALSAESGALNTPIFVVGHRPTANTVYDGAQASNAALTSDLSGYPQAVYFSGHSHLHLNDERSIWQGAFTAVNDGSMSYTETPHDAYQIYGDALWDEFTIPTAQALYVEVYADRTEIDRINFAAEDERTYTNGAWGYQSGYPFASAGTLAGPTWTVRLDGSTAEEVRANFDYTAAARDAVAPVQQGAPEHIVTNGADVLRVPAATDDEAVYGYDVRVRDAVTGAEALPIRAGAKVLADFQIAPRPSVLEIPLAIRNGRQADAPLLTLTKGTSYVAEVTAVDMYGNRSEKTSVAFVAGEVPDTTRPQVTLVSPASTGPSKSIDIRVDATDEVGLARIVANIYQGGKLVKSTQSAVSGASGSHVATVKLPDGAYTVKYNAQDAAGNISKTSTFDVVVDATAPTVTVKTGGSFTVGDAAGYDKVSFKLNDAGKVDRIALNGVEKDLTNNAWSDLNFVKPGTFGGVKGENTLLVYDVAGNVTTVEFVLR